jgi:hypothetical protein
VAGWSQQKIAKHFGIPLGTIAARCAQQKWVRWRPEVILQQLETISTKGRRK